MSRPAAVLLGAASQIGWFTAPRLAGAGYQVLAVSRGGQPAEFPDLDAVRWLRPADLAAGAPATLLVSAGPLALACELLGRLPALARVVAFSTSSVAVKADSADRRERDEVASIQASEQRLAAACAERGADLVLLRPTLVYGCGLDRNVSRLARWVRRWPLLPVAGRGAGLRQPVHADDLARTAVAAAVSGLRGRHEFFLAGGSTLAYRAMIGCVARATGRRVRLLPLPAGLLAAVASALRWLPCMAGLGPETMRRQALDLVFDDRPARRLLGHDPRPFGPGPEDLRLPDPQRLRRLASA